MIRGHQLTLSTPIGAVLLSACRCGRALRSVTLVEPHSPLPLPRDPPWSYPPLHLKILDDAAAEVSCALLGRDRTVRVPICRERVSERHCEGNGAGDCEFHSADHGELHSAGDRELHSADYGEHECESHRESLDRTGRLGLGSTCRRMPWRERQPTPDRDQGGKWHAWRSPAAGVAIPRGSQNSRIDSRSCPDAERLRRFLSEQPYGSTVRTRVVARAIDIHPKRLEHLVVTNPTPLIVPTHRVTNDDGHPIDERQRHPGSLTQRVLRLERRIRALQHCPL